MILNPEERRRTSRQSQRDGLARFSMREPLIAWLISDVGQRKMIATPPHNRKLGLLGVALVKARFPKSFSAALDAVRDEVEAAMISSGFLTGAPFSWVTIAVRYGLKNEEAPHFGRVSKKYGDLPLSIEVDTHELLHADLAEACAVIRRAVVRALLAAAAKYDRPRAAIEALKSKKPNQPPQRNAGSRPFSDDSSASETPFSLGPRG